MLFFTNCNREIPNILNTLIELAKKGFVEIIKNISTEQLDTYLHLLTIQQLRQIIKDASIKTKSVVLM